MSHDGSSDESSQQLHPIACVSCRKLHRKCNRTKPSCSKCQKRGIPCEYKDPEKRGKKTFGIPDSYSHDHSVPSSPYPPVPTLPEDEKQRHLDRSKTLDMFYHIFNCGSRVMERDEFETLLQTVPDHKPIQIMYLAIRALCEQRVGMNEWAERSMKQARSHLAKLFDDHSNFHIVCAYVFMCFYEAACGRLRTARYYLQSVDFYFEEMTQEEALLLTPQQENLRKTTMFARVWIGGEDHMVMLREWPLLMEMNGIRIEQRWKDVLAQPIRHDTYLSLLNGVDYMSDTMRDHFSEEKHSKLYKISTVIRPMMVYGFRIVILSQLNDESVKPVIEDAALRISLLTEHELFSLLPPTVVAHVVEAARVHLEMVLSMERGERRNHQLTVMPMCGHQETANVKVLDYYEILRKDYRALKMLNARFKKVTLFYGDVLLGIEKVLNTSDELLDGVELLNNDVKENQSEEDQNDLFESFFRSDEII